MPRRTQAAARHSRRKERTTRCIAGGSVAPGTKKKHRDQMVSVLLAVGVK